LISMVFMPTLELLMFLVMARMVAMKLAVNEQDKH